MVATKLGRCNKLDTRVTTSKRGHPCAKTRFNAPRKNRLGTIPAGTTQASTTQAGTHELNISSGSKLWEIVQHGRSNKAPSLQHDRGSNRGNQTTVVAAIRYMQQIHTSNTPHKAAKQDSQTKLISTCYCYGALNKFAGSTVANADRLPKFDFGCQVH